MRKLYANHAKFANTLAKLKKIAGFTLVELVVVIAIMTGAEAPATSQPRIF